MISFEKGRRGSQKPGEAGLSIGNQDYTQILRFRGGLSGPWARCLDGFLRRGQMRWLEGTFCGFLISDIGMLFRGRSPSVVNTISPFSSLHTSYCIRIETIIKP